MARAAHALDPDDPYALYNVACVLARLGDSEAALSALERAIDAGFGVGRRAWFERDPDFDSLRSLPRFQALLARI
jgi:adenylate cyclase